MEKLYEFHWDCGRQGNVNGMFIADEKAVDIAMGNEVSFGEILGKHSDVRGYLEECDLKVVEVSGQTVKELKNALGCTISGYNPLNYVSYTCARCQNNVYPGDEDVYLKEDEGSICSSCCVEEEEATLMLL